MPLTWRDALATLVVAALVVIYAVLLVNGSVGFIRDPRSMAVVGLLSSLVLCPRGIKSVDVWVGGMSVLGAATLGLGLVALTTQSWTILAIFMGAIVVNWMVATLHHALSTAARQAPRVGAAPA